MSSPINDLGAEALRHARAAGTYATIIKLLMRKLQEPPPEPGSVEEKIVRDIIQQASEALKAHGDA
jgi:hypothetical protein